MIVQQAGQMNRNGKKTAVLFLRSFLLAMGDPEPAAQKDLEAPLLQDQQQPPCGKSNIII